MAKKADNERLPRNFHKTFIPERQYINAILRFASKGGSGDIQTIAAQTGIPTGEFSGKVDPTLDYCKAMGLICFQNKGSIRTTQLTPFGRVVLLEDAFLKEPITQWIAHFKLCDPKMGAETWYQTFYAGAHILGSEFNRDQLDDYLAGVYMTTRRGLIGPLVRMYEDKASFSICGALSEESNIIRRRIPPISNELGYGYGVWLIQLLENFFPNITQVTVTELDRVAGWRTIPGWDASETQRVLEIIERKGIISVDRSMKPWILRPNQTSASVWPKIYCDLI